MPACAAGAVLIAVKKSSPVLPGRGGDKSYFFLLSHGAEHPLHPHPQPPERRFFTIRIITIVTTAASSAHMIIVAALFAIHTAMSSDLLYVVWCGLIYKVIKPVGKQQIRMGSP